MHRTVLVHCQFKKDGEFLAKRIRISFELRVWRIISCKKDSYFIWTVGLENCIGHVKFVDFPRFPWIHENHAFSDPTESCAPRSNRIIYNSHSNIKLSLCFVLVKRLMTAVVLSSIYYWTKARTRLSPVGKVTLLCLCRPRFELKQWCSFSSLKNCMAHVLGFCAKNFIFLLNQSHGPIRKQITCKHTSLEIGYRLRDTYRRGFCRNTGMLH
jgi:hypothetical protein